MASGVDVFEYAGNVVANVLQLKAARVMVMSKERGIFKDLVPQLKSSNAIRRQGASKIIKYEQNGGLCWLCVADPRMAFGDFQELLLCRRTERRCSSG